MFKFEFMPEAYNDGNKRGGGVASVSDNLSDRVASLRPSVEIPIHSDNVKYNGIAVESFEVSDTVSIVKRVGVVEAVENQASDLVAGEYEGGYKVWECSIDLSKYIAENEEIVRGKKVLELGCGQGLAGITAIMCGGVVHFQDYDVDVVENLTIPIVMRNIERADSTCSNNSRFFAGDWGTLREVLDETYDVVLTSETIYSVENMPRLLGCIKSCLKKPDGVCYVSAKSFYFGVGGGVAAFKKLVDADGDMSHTDIAVIDDGRSNRREIFKLSFAL